MTFPSCPRTLGRVAVRRAEAKGRSPRRGRPRLVHDPVRFVCDFERTDFEALTAAAEKRGVSVAEALRGIVKSQLIKKRRD